MYLLKLHVSGTIYPKKEILNFFVHEPLGYSGEDKGHK